MQGAYHSDVKTYTDSHPVPNPVEAPRHKRNPLLTASIGPQPKPLDISEDTTTEKPKPKAFAYQYGGGEDNTKFEQQNVEGQVRGKQYTGWKKIIMYDKHTFANIQCRSLNDLH